MERDGFVKLHRKILKWGWYSDTNTFRVFFHLLMIASFEDNEFRGHKIKAGQAVIGRKQLAKDLKLSEQSVRTALEHLKSTGEITTETTNRFTVVTIANWEKYQVWDKEINQQNNQPANQQSTNNQPTTNHTQESKNIKNNNIRSKTTSNELQNEFNELWQLYPRKQGKATAYRHYEKARKAGTTYEEVEKGIRAYAAYAKHTEAQYVKMGSTFFSQRAWEDDWTIPKAKPASNVSRQPEPPKYREFEPEPKVDKTQMPDEMRRQHELRKRISEIF